VIVQTLSPDHFCIRMAARHDFDGFMAEELAAREALAYPPYGRMLLLRLWGPDASRVSLAAEEVVATLSGPVAAAGMTLLGPAPSPVSFVKRKHHFQILLKMPASFPVGDFFPDLLRPLRDVVRRHGVRMEADVDPYNMMV
jgi:primosomal protein N' (replication factor Y)